MRAGSIEADRIRARLKSRLFGQPEAPLRVGRYEVLGRIGEGAMGTVYRARDPELEREVALKVLRDGGEGSSVLDEARAMARLEHPNVVRVYDVEQADERAFVAMELVRGQSLREWLREPRAPREIERVFAAAARGLHAAHRAGVVHRDFKPANVLVTDEGDVKVADFGLARAANASRKLADGEAPPSDAPMSRTQLAGTPHYLAPELLRGAKATAASDQFAFGVSLFEALTGKRPFAATSMRELSLAHARGPLLDRGLTRAQRKLIARLLALEPAARMADMGAVARALEPARRAGAGLGAGVALLGLSTLAYFGLRVRDSVTVCSGSEQRLAEVWSAEQRGQVLSSLASVDAPHAQQTADRTVAVLDAYSQSWVAARDEACEATQVRKEQSQEVMDRRMACLERRRTELSALVVVLSRADRETTERAVEGARALTPVARCDVGAGLERETRTPPPEVAARVLESRAVLAEAWASRAAGKYAGAQERARRAVELAESAAFPPAVAEALLELARTLLLSGQPQAAREAALRAADLAESAAEDELLAHSWLVVLGSMSKSATKPEDTDPFARRARAVIARMGEPSDLMGDLHEVLGAQRYVLGHWPEALEHAEQELSLRVASAGEGTLPTAEARAHLAAVLTNLDRAEEAESYLEQALADAEVWLGPDHPHLAAMLNAHGLNQKSRGQYAEARATHQRALGILERALGPDNPALEPALTNLGNASMHLGLLSEAEQHHRRAILIKEKLYGEEHPQVALGLNNLANVMIQSKRWDEAIVLHQRALSIRERSLAKGDRMIGMSLTNLGDALSGAGRHAEAIGQYRLSLDNLEQALGPDHSWLAYPLTGLAHAHLLDKRPDLAIAPAERALSIRDKPGLAEDLAAETRFVLARALIEAGKDKTRGLTLAKEARTVFVGAGEPKKQYLAELDAWLSDVERTRAGVAGTGLSGLHTSLGGGGLGRGRGN